MRNTGMDITTREQELVRELEKIRSMKAGLPKYFKDEFGYYCADRAGELRGDYWGTFFNEQGPSMESGCYLGDQEEEIDREEFMAAWTSFLNKINSMTF